MSESPAGLSELAHRIDNRAQESEDTNVGLILFMGLLGGGEGTVLNSNEAQHLKSGDGQPQSPRRSPYQTSSPSRRRTAPSPPQASRASTPKISRAEYARNFRPEVTTVSRSTTKR